MQKITFENLPSTNTPINATNLNAIQDNVEAVFNELDLLTLDSYQISTNGYLRWKNGFQLAWVEQTVTGDFLQWNGNIYYLNVPSRDLPNWPVAFTEAWQQYVTTDQVFYWSTSEAPTTTAPGLIRFLKINSQTGASIKAKIFAFGKWE